MLFCRRAHTSLPQPLNHRLWDGLTSGSDRIMVLGATNRPNDIDAAILRRMPKRYAVSLPDATQRYKILSIMLRGVALDPAFDITSIVRRTEGYSGSDLKELCRGAAMIPVREVLRSAEGRKRVQEAARANKAVALGEKSASASGSSTPKGGEAGGGGGAATPTSTTAAAAAGLKTRPVRNSDFFVNDSAATPLDTRMHVANTKTDPRARKAQAPPQDQLD